MGLQMSLLFRFPPEKSCRPIIGQAERLCFGFLLALHYAVYWVCTLHIPKDCNIIITIGSCPTVTADFHQTWPHAARDWQLYARCSVLRRLAVVWYTREGSMKMKGPESGYHQRRRDGFKSWMKCQCFGCTNVQYVFGWEREPRTCAVSHLVPAAHVAKGC